MTDESLTRSAILDALEARGGAHKSELCRMTGRGWGTIGHHVYVMVRDGRVETEVHGRKLWVFRPTMTRAERDWLIATSNPQRNRLLDVIRGVKPSSTISELSQEMATSKKIVRTHLGHLRRAGAVGKLSGNPPRYVAREPSNVKDQG